MASAGRKKFRRKPQPPAGYFTIKQAAEYLGVCERTIRRYIQSYGLPAQKPAGMYLINKTDLETWMRNNG